MSYGDLSLELQNLLWFNYESSTKFFIITGLFVISVLYLFYFRNNHQQTDNFIVAMSRVLLYIIFNMILFSFPIMYVILLAPSYSFNTLIITLLMIYTTCFTIFTVYIIFKIAVIMPISILKVGLLNPQKAKNIIFKELKLK